jgi:hypothetical protein
MDPVLLRVGDEWGQATMHGAPLELGGVPIDDGGQERVREAQAFPVDLQDAGPDGILDAVGLSGACAHQRKGWLRQRGNWKEGGARMR